MAKVTEAYLDGSARKAETYLGWKRHTVQLGLHERRTGLVCVDNYRARGRQKTEDTLPQLTSNIHELVEGPTQADPDLKTTLAYTEVSAQSVLTALITEKGKGTVRLSYPAAKPWARS